MSRIELAREDASAEAVIPPAKPDGSGVGVNYADKYLKVLKKVQLEDGRLLKVKRRGLKITVQLGSSKGEGLLRRLEHGPDVKNMLAEALAEAARGLGVEIHAEDGSLWLTEP